MEVHYKLFILLSVSCFCDGHLQRLGGFLSEAHKQIHSTAHDVAGAVIGGFGSIVGGHFGHRGHARPPSSNNGGDTVLVIIEETSPDNGGRPQMPYRPSHPPPPNHGYNPNHPYHQYPGPNKPGYNGHNGQRPYQPNNHGNEYPDQNQLTHNNENINGHDGNNHNFNGNTQPGQNQGHGNTNNNGNIHGNNENNQDFNSNGNFNQDAQGNPNNPVHNGNKFTNPEQNKPNLDNYKPTEVYNDQQNKYGHVAENSDSETNDKTTKKPTSEGPLLVPLNDYTYGGDKITMTAPKREADKTEGAAAEGDDEEFPIDIRFKDE